MALIYIVEDDINIREIEEFALKNSGYQVYGFDCARVFFSKIREILPDLILLDIMLPDEDGMSILKKLRSTTETKRIPVIMVTAKTTELDKVKGLDQGADDYLAKPFGIMELIARVKAVLRRSVVPKEKVLVAGEIRIENEKRQVLVNGTPCELTYKEYELLRLLAGNQGIVMTREMIMEQVWGTEFEGESRTLDMHIKTLRQKLGSAGARIKTLRNVGYMLEV